MNDLSSLCEKTGFDHHDNVHQMDSQLKKYLQKLTLSYQLHSILVKKYVFHICHLRSTESLNKKPQCLNHLTLKQMLEIMKVSIE